MILLKVNYKKFDDSPIHIQAYNGHRTYEPWYTEWSNGKADRPKHQTKYSTLTVSFSHHIEVGNLICLILEKWSEFWNLAQVCSFRKLKQV